MNLTIIAAVAENKVIGNAGALPWSLPEDLERFRQLTSHHPVIIRRKTYSSILDRIGKLLPHRQNIMVSSQEELVIPQGFVFHAFDIECAIRLAQDYHHTAFVIGGATLYQQFLPLATPLEITEVYASPPGDVFFASIEGNVWRETERIPRDGYSFVLSGKRNP
ncbi:dihydrofolate reductase [Candidatus Pacearchaeota archaeon]|nr:dihydrofolate reductase [Candidatus Pacearchaeota archaeon]